MPNLHDNPEFGAAMERYHQWRPESREDGTPVGMLRYSLAEWHRSAGSGEVFAHVRAGEDSAVILNSTETEHTFEAEVGVVSANPAERTGPFRVTIGKYPEQPMMVDMPQSAGPRDFVERVFPGMLPDILANGDRRGRSHISERRYRELRQNLTG